MISINSMLFIAATLSGAITRQDISQNLGTVVCAATTDSRPLAAWEQGVYDAQIEGRLVEKRAGRDVTPSELQRKAHALAQTRGHLGYAAGSCANGTAWVAATPAPAPPIVSVGHTITLPKVLTSACESFRVDFAAAAGGVPKELGAVLTVDTPPLGDGVVSVSCQPSRPRHQGPVLWYLIPVGKGPAEVSPMASALKEGAPRFDLQLMSWINAVRRAESLKPVVFKNSLNDEASVLAIDPTLTHNRAMLRKVGDSLDAGNVRLIGEDRVKGRTAEVMAWLLWNSPRHRALLLDKSATVAGLAVKDLRDETLVVLVFGEDQPLKTAKRDGATGKRKR